jgi:hypothetical protein
VSQADNFQSYSKAELLPTKELALKWMALLQELQDEREQTVRDRQFLFMHGWLRGLVDAGKLGIADLPELRELAFRAAHGKS